MILKELIDECKAHNRKAQKELFERFSQTIFASCLKYAPTYQEAQDILQDSFIIIFQKIDQFHHEGSFEGWCRRIAINTALQRYRKVRVVDLVYEDQLQDDQANDIETDLEQIDLKSLLQMVQQLPHRYRMVFSMYVLDDFSHKEIAELLDISVGTSKSNLARARGLLKDKVTSWREEQNSNVS